MAVKAIDGKASFESINTMIRLGNKWGRDIVGEAAQDWSG